MRAVVFLFGAMALVSCAPPSDTGADSTRGSANSQRASGAAEEDAALESEGHMLAMTGVDLYMHDYTPSDGEPREPTFWVHAESGKLSEGTKIWTLEDTNAVIYREVDEDLAIVAEHGRFDQNNDVAVLTGDVRLSTSEVVIYLEEVLWNNAEGVARSEKPLTVESGRTRLKADRAVIEPREDKLTLYNGSGMIQLGESDR